MNLDSLYYLLANWNQSHFLNFKFGHFFREIRYRYFCNNRDLLSYIHGNSFFDLYILCCQYFFDYWLINKDFNLFNNFHLVSFDEMRSFDEYFFGNFTNNFSLLNYRNFFYDFFVFIGIDESISVLNEIDYLYLVFFDLYWDFLFNIDYFFLFDDVVYILLDLFVFWLFYYDWNSDLNLLYSFDSLVNIVRNLDYSLYFNIFFFFCLNKLLGVVDFYFINNSFSLDFLHNLSLLI